MNLKKIYIQLKKYFNESLLIFRLGYPLIISHLLLTLIELIDSIMVGNISSLDLAAVALAFAIYHPIFLFTLGIMIPLSSIIAQLFGEKNYEEIGNNAIQGFWLSQIFAFFSIFIFLNVDFLLYKFGYEEEMIKISTDYLKALCLGIPALYGFISFRMFSEGLSITRPTMYLSIIGLGLKVILNYMLIYGFYEIPSFGTVGAGWSTSISHWFMLIIFLYYFVKTKTFINYKKLLVFRKPSSRYLREILRIGLPHGLGIAAETGLFTAVSLMIGKFGVTALAAHQIAINFASITFMIPMGLSIAISIRVGLSKGKSDFKETQYIGRVGISICIILMSLASLFIIFFSEMIVKLYTNEFDLMDQAIKFLFFAAIFQISDGMQVGALGALRGLKDTRIPFFTNVFSYWIVGLPTAYIVGIKFKYGPEGMWVGLIIGLSVAAVLHTYRFKILTNRLFILPHSKDLN